MNIFKSVYSMDLIKSRSWKTNKLGVKILVNYNLTLITAIDNRPVNIDYDNEVSMISGHKFKLEYWIKGEYFVGFYTFQDQVQDIINVLDNVDSGVYKD